MIAVILILSVVHVSVCLCGLVSIGREIGSNSFEWLLQVKTGRLSKVLLKRHHNFGISLQREAHCYCQRILELISENAATLSLLRDARGH